MSEKQIGAVFKFEPDDIKPFMDGNIPEDAFPWVKYVSRLASMASNSVGKQLINRLKEVDRPCEVKVVVSVDLDFSILPEGTVFKEVDR